MRILTEEINDPSLLCAYEEALITLRQEDKIPDTIWILKIPQCIYMCTNFSLNYLNNDYARINNYPLCRSAVFNGRSTSANAHEHGYSLFYVGKHNFGDYGDEIVTPFWSQYLPIEKNASYDLIIPGTDKKIGGAVPFKKDDVYFCSPVFTEIKPNLDLDILFNFPSEKFEGKTVNSANERVTSYFNETGETLDYEEIVGSFMDFLNHKDIVASKGVLTKDELDLVDSLSPKFLSDNWIKYARRD